METKKKAIAPDEFNAAYEMAKTLFDEDQISGYCTVNAFIGLYGMVNPEDRPELAMILQGIVK